MQFTDLAGQGPHLHFAHANAYPPGSYRRMLEVLSGSHRIKCIHWLPLIQPDHHPHFRNWHELIPDLVEFIESEMDPPVLAAGHSMGATLTMMTAVRRPDLFRAIALIDPVLLPLRHTLPLRILPRRWAKRVPIIRKALGRPDRWETRQQAFDFHRRARAFSGLDDEGLWDYIRAGTRQTGDGRWVLSFPKAWEAVIYATCPWVWPELRRCRVPMLGIRGCRSDVISDPTWAGWKRLQPAASFIEFSDAGHLVPFERPVEVGRAVLEFFAGFE